MESELDPALAAFRARARRTYEAGRLRSAAWRAASVAAVVAAAGWAWIGPHTLAWVSLTFVLWLATWWWGGAPLRGARYGLTAGAVTFLLPLSLLRPCCRPGVAMTPTGDCCTMPGMCVLIGSLVGLSLAWFVPRGRGARRAETAAGMALGVASIAAIKCSALFLGEALGLLGGLVAGITAVSAVAALLDRRRAAAA